MPLSTVLSRIGIATWSVCLLYPGETPNTGMADPEALIRAFDQYQANLPDGGRSLTIPLGTLRGISSGGFNAGGSVQIDLSTNAVTSTVRGLPTDASFDLWPGP